MYACRRVRASSVSPCVSLYLLGISVSLLASFRVPLDLPPCSLRSPCVTLVSFLPLLSFVPLVCFCAHLVFPPVPPACLASPSWGLSLFPTFSPSLPSSLPLYFDLSLRLSLRLSASLFSVSRSWCSPSASATAPRRDTPASAESCCWLNA